MPGNLTVASPNLHRRHHQRLREVYRSSGWPCQDMLEVELLASGLLERRIDTDGRETLRVTDAGLVQLAQAHAGNKAARSAHEALVERVCLEMGRAGRLVSRADLLGDLKKPGKRAAYLGLGGECWYVLGQTAKGKPIALPDEIPPECGVMLSESDQGEGLVIARPAPRKPMARMPHHIWMALAKATPVARAVDDGQVNF